MEMLMEKAAVTQTTTHYNQGLQNTTSEHTTHPTLKQTGYSSRGPHRAPLLSAKNRKLRIPLAQVHQSCYLFLAWSDQKSPWNSVTVEFRPFQRHQACLIWTFWVQTAPGWVNATFGCIQRCEKQLKFEQCFLCHFACPCFKFNLSYSKWKLKISPLQQYQAFASVTIWELTVQQLVWSTFTTNSTCLNRPCLWPDI